MTMEPFDTIEAMHEAAIKEQVNKARDLLLRSAGRRQFNPSILSLMKPGVAVHADRRTGKTEALLTAVYEKEDGKAIIVVRSKEIVELTRERYRDGFRNSPHFPTILVAANNVIEGINGNHAPIYCDEWFEFGSSVKSLLAPKVKAAVGSMPGLAGCLEVFPLLGRNRSDLHINGVDESLNEGISSDSWW